MSYAKDRIAEIKATTPLLRRPPRRLDPDLSSMTADRFWSKVAITSDNQECWLWRGARHGNGYGNFRVSEMYRATIQAHRVAFYLTNEGWPEPEFVVRHKCDNPLCCNPHHLETGTAADNARDKVQRGRNRNRYTGRILEG